MYDLTIPRRIVRKREALGLAGYELAKRARISPSYLSLIENGQKIPSEKVALELARVLGDDPELYRAWVENAGEPDLEARAERLRRIQATRSEARRSIDAATSPGGGMRAWQRWRRKASEAPEPLRDEIRSIDVADMHEEPVDYFVSEPEMLRVPVLDEGAEPADAGGVHESIAVDPALLDVDVRNDRLFAYRVSSRSIANVTEVVSPGDVLVFAADPDGIDPAAIYAVRHRGRVVLSRVAYARPTLLLMPGQSGQSPTPIAVSDPRALGDVLAGVAVACIRTWSKPAVEFGAASVEPALGRTGQLDDEGNIVRDCEWRDNYGWRPLQKADDLDYLIANPGRTIRFRLIRDGKVRYVLEMNAEQWQEALGDYYGGPTWYRNGYIVATTKRREGEYTEEFQERWAGLVHEPDDEAVG